MIVNCIDAAGIQILTSLIAERVRQFIRILSIS